MTNQKDQKFKRFSEDILLSSAESVTLPEFFAVQFSKNQPTRGTLPGGAAAAPVARGAGPDGPEGHAVGERRRRAGGGRLGGRGTYTGVLARSRERLS